MGPFHGDVVKKPPAPRQAHHSDPVEIPSFYLDGMSWPGGAGQNRYCTAASGGVSRLAKSMIWQGILFGMQAKCLLGKEKLRSMVDRGFFCPYSGAQWEKVAESGKIPMKWPVLPWVKPLARA